MNSRCIKRIALDCVHELPAHYADLVDTDYKCPVVVYAKQSGRWDITRMEWLSPDVRIVTSIGFSTTIYQSKVSTDYPHASYFIVMDVPEITEEILPEALDRLNDALENHLQVRHLELVDINTRFYHDPFIQRSAVV